MKRLLIATLLLGFTFIGTAALAGNGAPSGAHYNLNIIGVPKGKTADMTGTSGHSLFVPLSGTTKILLKEGAFSVLDRNGTDGSASFQLPSPDPDGDGVTAYSIFARALGKPGGSAQMTTCETDTTTGDVYCSTESVILVRAGGKSSFSNVTRELTTIYLDTDGDGLADTRTSLFSNPLMEYFWEFINNGLKLVQLRFYEIPTDVN